MKIYAGKSVSDGIAIGKLRIFLNGKRTVRQDPVTDIRGEEKRFEQARSEALEQLQYLCRKALKEAGASGAAIFEAHQMLLQDQAYVGSVIDMIRTQAVNAEYAVAAAGKQISAMFADMDDAYMRERSADVQDLTDRLVAVLQGRHHALALSGEPVILVADDLSPSDMMQLDREKLLAFVTLHGSVNSHTAILAETMGIPGLIGAELPLEEPWLDGTPAALDPEAGCLFVEPDEETLAKIEEKRSREQEAREQLKLLKDKKSVTLDGKEIFVYGNIGHCKDLEAILKNGAEGIGLFRSECLFLGKETYPTEEEQFQMYRRALQTMEGRPVIIRTLDMGSDKQADYFGLAGEENPAMGCRGIRVSLARPQIAKVQLRALLRASIYGNLSIMYPMVTSVKEVQAMKRLVEDVKRELEDEKLPCKPVKQGIMIETPAAAMISDLLAKEVDFFSIGTNDLTQYVLGMDRQNQLLDGLYDTHHPAVLRMIFQTAQNARKAGIPCEICGELGADTAFTALFLAMGIDGLSVAPGSVLPVRRQIRNTDIGKEKDALFAKWL